MLRCLKHRLEGYVNLDNAHCIVCFSRDGIYTRARYGKVGVRSFCGYRGKRDLYMIDVVCAQPSCINVAIYGRAAVGPIHCLDHKEADEFDVLNVKCAYESCDEDAYYGMKGPNFLYCVKHTREGDVNLASRLCELNCVARMPAMALPVA